MRRKTAPKDPAHPEVSRAVASEVGLIAKKECAQSAMGEYVLDNRSHRTTQGSGVRGRRARLSSRPKNMDGPASPAADCWPVGPARMYTRVRGGYSTPRAFLLQPDAIILATPAIWQLPRKVVEDPKEVPIEIRCRKLVQVPGFRLWTGGNLRTATTPCLVQLVYLRLATEIEPDHTG